MPETTSGTAVQIVRGLGWHQTCFCLVFIQKSKPETFLVGSEAYKLEVKASHMLLRGLHPTKTQRPFVELRVKASDVFLCGLHPKNEAKRPFWWAPRLTSWK